MLSLRTNVVLGVVLSVCLSACGSVTGTDGNDVPPGAAVPIAGSNPDCTRDGTGINVTVTPEFESSADVQANVAQNVPAGVDTAVPICYDYQTQMLTAPAMLLTQMQLTVKDGVVQPPSSDAVKIYSQWFQWDEPTPGTCQAVIEAVVNITDGSMPTCSVMVILGADTVAPIGTYAVSGT